MKNILILDWSQEWRGYILDASRELGLNVYLILDRDRKLPDDIVDVYIIKDLYVNPVQWKDKICEFAVKSNIDGVFTNEDELSELASHIAKELKLVGPSPKSVRISMNKWETRNHLSKYNIPMPKYRKASTYDEFKEAVYDLGLPLVVKPIDGNFSMGASKVENLSELGSAWYTAYKATEDSPSLTREVIVEEYLDDEGRVITFESAIIDNIIYPVAITEELQFSIVKNNCKQFLYHGGLVPARVNTSISNDIIKVSTEILNALELNNVITHIEYKITKDGVRLLEVNPRMAGGFVPVLCKMALGIDLAKVALNIAMGDKPVIKKQKIKYVGIKYYQVLKEGVVTNILGKNEMLNSPYVVDGNIIIKKGDYVKIGELPCLAYVITQHTNPESALENSKKALSKLIINIE
ncbi:ATP-grasp domain-containing protein [Tepidibacillus infernus]|uniref:ATP-grasp domain-containing protein n=1 Tax=Tepidibacillus infernus TaxID=1806172 RepID=UPI003B68FA5C